MPKEQCFAQEGTLPSPNRETTRGIRWALVGSPGNKGLANHLPPACTPTPGALPANWMQEAQQQVVN